MLNDFKLIQKSLSDLVPAISQASTDVVNGVVRELEQRAIGAGTVTKRNDQHLSSKILA